VQTLIENQLSAVSCNIESLANLYAQLSDDGRTDTAGMLHAAVKAARERSQMLQSAATDAVWQLNTILKKKNNFEHNRETTLSWLQGLDKELKTVETLSVDELQCCSVPFKVCTMDVDVMLFML